MRFRIRFADQIVGIFTIVALAALVAVIFLLGSHQRWFARDVQSVAYFESASGISRNMAVQYKGFTIGNIKTVRLTLEDQVEVAINIFDNYADRVKEGSLVELRVSPIGLGNQFLFYPGLGQELLDAGAVIPNLHSPEGQNLIDRGLAVVPNQMDSITLLVTRANTLLESINKVVAQVETAFAGTDETSLGRSVKRIEGVLAKAEETLSTTEGVVSGFPGIVEELQGSLDGILGDVKPVVKNLETLSATLADPEGAIALALDSEGAVYTSLEESLKSVSGTLRNLERTTDFIPTQLPQIAALILELRETLQTAESVLISLTNNPLLKNGIPPQVKTETTGTSSRDIRF
jgi:phospholipid/cholesterol/gamma-HCH transport system substrate-binding protein